MDFPHDHGLRRLFPTVVSPDETTQSRLDALTEVREALLEAYNAGSMEEDEAEQQLCSIDTEIADLTRPVYSEEVRAQSGVFVSLGWDGSVRIDRGFVRPEDEPDPEARSTVRQALR